MTNSENTSDFEDDEEQPTPSRRLVRERVMQALQAAQAVHQPSDVALAQALAIQSDWAMGLDRSETITLYVAALQQSDRHGVSWRSRRVVDHVLHCVQPSYMPRRF